MNKPQPLDILIDHLKNDCHIDIDSSLEKQQLICYGYYHGYKGYRFFTKPTTLIPFENFSQLVAIIEYDNSLKSILYPVLMFLETALKNIVCNIVVQNLENATFECVFQNKMNDNTANAPLQQKRLQLKNRIYGSLSSQYKKEEHKENQMIRHFYNQGKDVPIWAIFEILSLGDFATFLDCLNTPIRENILNQLRMLDISLDTNCALLSNCIYSLKSLRNAVAHNNVIYDTRFKDRKISKSLKRFLEKETGIHNITLYTLTDYIILVSVLLKHIDFSNERAAELVQQYEYLNQDLYTYITPEIFSTIMYNNTAEKISLLKKYLE